MSALCMECGEPAAFKCLRCVEETCREHLENHQADECPGDREEPPDDNHSNE